MLDLLGKSAECIENVFLLDCRRILDALALGQACRHASASQRRSTPVRDEGDPFHFFVSGGQPELHGVATRSGDARVTVELPERSKITRVRRVIARDCGKTFKMSAFHMFYCPHKQAGSKCEPRFGILCLVANLNSSG